MKYRSILLIACFALLVPFQVHAEYILPYPSYMPGNKLYAVSNVWDIVQSYWQFGSIAQAKYHMSMADKYLVEAKTLFEYRQYLLGVSALQRSNDQMPHIRAALAAGTREGKDMTLLSQAFREERAVHVGVLENLRKTVPEVFTWTPEKANSSILYLWDLITQAVTLRER